MEIIKHRINTIEQLKKTHTKYGVEVDIRTFGNELVISHDPFSFDISFNEWISFYAHGTLILNVKEDGLEDRLLNEMQKHKIENFFILDQAFPYLIKTIKSGEKRCAIRFSEYESINTVLSIKGFADWVWVDFFTKFPLDKYSFDLLKDNNFKLCIVSPELQGYGEKTVLNLKNFIKNNNFKFDAVCTKHVEIWKDF